jgi:hypothetical protein
MARMVLSFFVACCTLSACVPVAPSELEGLWSRSEGACRAGAGVRFEADAVRVFYGRDDKVLFEDPVYVVERRGEGVRVRIDYALPSRSGGVSGQGSRGRLILDRDAQDWIRPVSHQFADKTTGSVRVRLGEEDATRFFTLQRCATAKP